MKKQFSETCSDSEMHDLLSLIRAQLPVFSDAEKSLAETMERLPEKPLSVQKRSFTWWKIVSNTAAVFLVGLFVFQQVKDNTKIENLAENRSVAVIPKFEKSDECLFTDEYTRLHPREVYLCYLKSNVRKPNLYEKLKK